MKKNKKRSPHSWIFYVMAGILLSVGSIILYSSQYSRINAVLAAKTTIKVTPKPTSITSTTTTKEYSISLGSGTNTSEDWADVPGVRVKVNSANYGKIKQVFFEASAYLPSTSQQTSIRLYNITDKHPVWFSEVSFEGNTPQLLTSGAIQLDSGEKIYQVQMKGQLKALTQLVQSRIRIIAN